MTARLLALAALLTLVGCGLFVPSGTQLSLDGMICGQPVDLKLNDRSDRVAFDLLVECPGGGSVAVSTSEKGVSPVASVDAAVLQALIARIPALAPVP